MTREEAIECLSERVSIGGTGEQNCMVVFGVNTDTLDEAFDMAISAIRQQEAVTKCNDLYDEDGGEIPLNAKTMTLNDAIAHLDDTLSDTGRKWSCESCRMEHVQLRAWLAELRDIKQDRNATLTLDELRKMDGEPVWVEFQDGSGGCWGLVHITVFNHIVFANGLFCTVGKPYYGKTWLAYRQKPEEESHQ